MKNPFTNKPKVLVCVLTSIERGGWVNPYLTQNLIAMSHDSRFTVQVEMVIDRSPVDYARNACVAMARERGVEWLFMVDNDQSFIECAPLDILSRAGDKHVLAFPTMQGFAPDSEDPIVPNFRTLDRPDKDGEFFTVDKVGTGAIFVNRRVWERISGPWFITRQADDELRTPAMHGEDFFFCELVRKNGFKVWIHRSVIPHWKTAEVAKLGMFFQSAKQIAAQARASAPSQVEWRAK